MLKIVSPLSDILGIASEVFDMTIPMGLYFFAIAFVLAQLDFSE